MIEKSDIKIGDTAWLVKYYFYSLSSPYEDAVSSPMHIKVTNVSVCYIRVEDLDHPKDERIIYWHSDDEFYNSKEEALEGRKRRFEKRIYEFGSEYEAITEKLRKKLILAN